MMLNPDGSPLTFDWTNPFLLGLVASIFLGICLGIIAKEHKPRESKRARKRREQEYERQMEFKRNNPDDYWHQIEVQRKQWDREQLVDELAESIRRNREE
jgi:hypothetical protein